VARQASAPQEIEPLAAKPAFAPALVAPTPVAAPAAEVISTPPSSGPVLETSLGGEEEVEEYDAELIEILDDGDVASVVSEPDSEESPIELRASLPSVEVRRHAQSSRPPPSRPAVAAVAPLPQPVAPAAVVAAPTPLHVAASAPLHAELVARRPVAAGAVVQSPAPRPEARSMSFVDLLDASLKLGG
ncbi:MAG TPA: hypothetical protein VG963_29295, partial [Polyangiaceae bacterium]|nr:hypothetical protein [Polyangiaceae bacterium]